MSYLVDPQLEKIQKLVDYASAKDSEQKKHVLNIIEKMPDFSAEVLQLQTGPFQSEEAVISAIVEAGLALSQMKFVSSVFGNISVCFQDRLYISATGSKLADLKNSIVKCDMNGYSLNGLIPSSELPTHLRIANETTSTCVLHAHPFFTVAYSMIKGINNSIFGVPVVGGDVGGGDTGIVHTVPVVLQAFNITAVHAHGVFAVDSFDFNNPLVSIFKLEKLCRNKYMSEFVGLN
ncbi:MAG TPA: class II aldolase/adducin family protein [bacterium]|nr:class II aldolase/adducin family protein [bacterium]